MNTVRNDLKTGHIRNLYVLTGTEDYLRRLYCDKLAAAILPEEDTMNKAVYDGSKADPMEVLDFALTLPFLAEHRLIIMNDSGWLKSAGTFADHIEEIPDTTYMIFMEKDTDKRNKLFRYIEEHGHIAVFEAMKEQDTVSFIANRLKSHQLLITEDNAMLMISQCGNDLTALSNEIDKIAAYCYGQTEVTREDILTMTSVMSQGQMFKMVDAIVAGNKKQAMKLYRDLLMDQTNPGTILYNLINNFYQFSMILRLNKKGLSPVEIGSQLKMNSYVVTKFLKVSSKTSIDKVTAAVDYGIELENRVKTGNMIDTMAVELFLNSQCTER